MKLSILLIIVISMGAFAFDQDGREGNGGDPVALQFNQAAQSAIQFVKSESQLAPEFRGVDLLGRLFGTKVYVVDTPLFVDRNGKRQEVAAMNYKNPDNVVINRKRWKSITSQKIRQALALHEILSLEGLESTGVYTYSQQYLNEVGYSCEEDLCIKFTRQYKSVWHRKWLVKVGDLWAEKSCNRGEILDLKDTAEREALDACYEAGNSNCRRDGATTLYNGRLDSKEACELIGKEYPCGSSVISLSNWHGCIVRGSATAED